MAVYLVRLIDSKEAVGVFWAPTLNELGHVIDGDSVDPNICEVKRLIAGGIGWFMPTRVTFPLTMENDDEYEPVIDRDKIEFSSITLDDMLSDDGWRILVWNPSWSQQ